MKRSHFRDLLRSIREAGAIERGEMEPAKCTVFYISSRLPHATASMECPCGRNWQAVYPVGATQLECPRCHEMIPAPLAQ